MLDSKLKKMNADFVEFLYKKFFSELGASEDQAAAIARGISMGDY